MALRCREVFVLDGDRVRDGLCDDLGFSQADRNENVRRIGCIAAMASSAGILVVVACISPYRESRMAARALVPDGLFVEVFIDTPLSECERRDPKGLYAKARAGAISNMTGVGDPYEPPIDPELRIVTVGTTPRQCAERIVNIIERSD